MIAGFDAVVRYICDTAAILICEADQTPRRARLPTPAHAATVHDPVSSPGPSQACRPASPVSRRPAPHAVRARRAAGPGSTVLELVARRRGTELLADQPDELLLRHRMRIVPRRCVSALAALSNPAGPVGANVARAQMGGRRVERADRAQRIVRIRLDEARMLAVNDDDPKGQRSCHGGCLLAGSHAAPRTAGRALIRTVGAPISRAAGAPVRRCGAAPAAAACRPRCSRRPSRSRRSHRPVRNRPVGSACSPPRSAAARTP